MSHFVPQPLFPVGSWVRNKDPEWPQTPWQVQEHLRADDHAVYCCVLTRSGRGRRERGFAPEHMLTLATPESASAYFAPYRPAAAVDEDHARKHEQDERIGFFGVDRSAPSGLAAWLPNAGPSSPPSVLAGTTTCATCGKVHGLLCALAIDRILKKQAFEDAEPKTLLLSSAPSPDLLKELIASSLRFNPETQPALSAPLETDEDFRAAAERAAAHRRDEQLMRWYALTPKTALRCPSCDSAAYLRRTDSGWYCGGTCGGWHGASLTAPPPEPRFKVGQWVTKRTALGSVMCWQVMQVNTHSGDRGYFYDLSVEHEGEGRSEVADEIRLSEMA